jgi:hypothetical protein
MQRIASIHYQDPRFKIVFIQLHYVHPLRGVCTFNNKLCVFDRQFDEDRVDIYLIPFMKKLKILFNIKLSKLKNIFK